MKKITSVFLILILLITFSASVSAAEKAGQPSIVMAINEETAIVDDTRKDITAPVLVFNKTYVDLYAVAPLLGIGVQWNESYIGYFSVIANNNTYKFTLTCQWDDLINQKYKFFAKDSKIYVSLRELADLSGYDISYDKGIITLGKKTDFSKEIYGEISTQSLDEYVRATYPKGVQYTVNPYRAYSYENMLEDADKLQWMYPGLVNISSIGKSVEDRNLLLIEFGRGDKKVFVCGTHHGREYISTTYLMYAIDRYAYAYANGGTWGGYNVREILDNVTFCIVPMVNPDGVNLVQNGIQATKTPDEIASMGIYEGKKYGYSAWKANIRGVDLNWNYDKDWSAEKNKNPRGSVGFNGDYPGSEPETIAVSDYVDDNLFDAYLSVHTQGQIFYWGESKANPSYINEEIKKDTGFIEYPDDGTGIGGSFFDYVYRQYDKPTITLELCRYIGDFPYPDKDFDAVWNPAKNVMLIIGNSVMQKNIIE